MALDLKGLRTVVYFVTDLESAKVWYSNVLGIEPYFDEPFYVGFNIGGYELGLHPSDTAASGRSTGTAYWGVEDVEAAFKRLQEEGAHIEEEPSDVGGGIKIASVTDPWGNSFGIIYNPHFTIG